MAGFWYAQSCRIGPILQDRGPLQQNLGNSTKDLAGFFRTIDHDPVLYLVNFILYRFFMVNHQDHFQYYRCVLYPRTCKGFLFYLKILPSSTLYLFIKSQKWETLG